MDLPPAVTKQQVSMREARSIQVIDDPDTDSLMLILENAEGGTLEPVAMPGAPPGAAVPALPEHRILQHVRDICKVRCKPCWCCKP